MEISDDLDYRFNFLVFLTKTGSPLSTNSRFYIIPRGIFLTSIKNKLWLTLCDKLIVFYMSKNFKNNFNLGILLLLLVYYIVDLINIKTKLFKNFVKFYTKDERQTSIGNYYCFTELNNFERYIHTTKMLSNELLFDLTNYIYLIRNPFEFDIYQTILNSKMSLNKLKLLVFSPLELEKK